MNPDLSNQNNASARGGQRASYPATPLALPRVNLEGIERMKWIMQSQRLMRETGASAEEVIAAARQAGTLVCDDADVPSLVQDLNFQLRF